MSAPQRYLAMRFVVLFLATVAFIDLFAMLPILVLHAAYPASISSQILAPLSYILAGASGAALVLGTVYALLLYPLMRNTILILALIVLGLLGAHLWTINTPALGKTASLQTPIGDTVKDSPVMMSSNFSGSTLQVTISDVGSDAIGSLSVAESGTVLPDSGFVHAVTPESALQPGASDAGTWSLPSPPSGPLTLTYEDLTCYATDKQVDGCVMDEVYYVPAAQTLLAGEKCAPYADNCNLEHPFLSKAFIGAGIAMFGNDTFGWRIFNVILGTFSVPILFGICWAITKNQRLSLYAAFLLAFETLFFVHSSVAVIDISAMFFGLLGFFLYFAKVRWWKFNHVLLAGVALGLAALSKETAVFLYLVLLFYILLFGEGFRKQVAYQAVWFSVWVFVVFVVGLETYDALFGLGVANNFVGQIDFILRYGGGLVMTPSSQGWIDTVLKTPITPLNWITYYSPVGYLVTNVSVTSPTGSYSYVAVGYYGITNQFEVWLVYFWGGYVIYQWWKHRHGLAFENESDARDYTVAKLALLWFLFVYLGYWSLFLYGRITYPYYFIEAVPALSIGAAYFLSRKWFPPAIAYIVLGGVFLWFFIFYPDKSFLPTQLRVLLGH